MSKPRNTTQRVIHFDKKAMNELNKIKELKGENNSSAVRLALGIACRWLLMEETTENSIKGSEYSVKEGKI